MSTAFLKKFENRVSVTNRDGTITKVDSTLSKVGGDGAAGASRLHPALLASDLGESTQAGRVWPALTEATSQAAAEDDAQLGPISPQRKVKAKPSAAELEVSDACASHSRASSHVG